MEDVDSNPLLQLVNKRMKFHSSDDDCSASAALVSFNNVRLSPLIPLTQTVVETPATSALEQFLQFAVEDLPPLTSVDDDDSSVGSEDSEASFPLMPTLKPILHGRHMDCSRSSFLPIVHDVTRGMARMSASD
eukprot:CAMPEP_0194047026 /NCGR_PEP_ID=MMETSP0009_2-20130614/23518_1 /TAXON_ID=210454 /ORGANISM="Grammatophora oceanica, Strain CCMP 410" /LENGTH=132 /DNA_ID=CAMNT_0038692537 /DNA_START=162 /DNA_END=560 /DNA_ORIENTATION=+